jgi:hypothetical protein
MRRMLVLAMLAMTLAACAADILGLDPLGPVVRSGDDEDPPPDAGFDAGP